MHRGEVWNLEPGKKNPQQVTRPVLLLSNDALSVLPLRIVVPLIPWQEHFTSAPWMVRIPPVLDSGLSVVMAADALQVRSVSSSRLKVKLGNLPDRLAVEVADAVALLIRGEVRAQV